MTHRYVWTDASHSCESGPVLHHLNLNLNLHLYHPPPPRLPIYRLTGELGLGNNLGQELGEVGQVLAEEVGLEDNSLTGMVGGQLAAEELGLAGDTEGGALRGVLNGFQCQYVGILA